MRKIKCIINNIIIYLFYFKLYIKLYHILFPEYVIIYKYWIYLELGDTSQVGGNPQTKKSKVCKLVNLLILFKCMYMLMYIRVCMCWCMYVLVYVCIWCVYVYDAYTC